MKKHINSKEFSLEIIARRMTTIGDDVERIADALEKISEKLDGK